MTTHGSHGPEDAAQRWQTSMMDNYATPGITLAEGSGCEVTDTAGRTYLDLLGGIAVNTLGHAHPAVVEAVTGQVGRLGHVSNFYAHEPGLRLAEELLAVAGVRDNGRVLFCNSGAEANEAAFKIARLTGRRKMVAASGGFHGRTMGALALTGQPAKQEPFEPLPAGVVHVPYGDARALEAETDEATAAIVLEPVQGEAGIVVPPDDYLRRAREIATRHGALLIVDEVQTGIGRTGHWFAFQRSGITPDVITLAKGVGGGLPLGVCIGVGQAGTLLRPGQHGTTFGGNPISCAAGLAVLRTIAEQGLLEHAEKLGKDIATRIEALRHPLIDHVRGAGLLLGVALRQEVAPRVTTAARERGYLINPVRPDTLRLAPPLVLRAEQAHRFVAELPSLLSECAQTGETT